MTTARLVSPRPFTTHPLAPWPVSPELAALRIAYSDLATIASSIDEEDSWRPTRCAGWVVRDLLLHLLDDAQRALVALGSPAAGPADRDAVSYWTDGNLVDEPQFGEIRSVRTMASAWSLSNLVHTFVETSRAVVTLAGRAMSDALVATQGHVLRTDDLLATLTVEAAVHHLDLVVDLNRPGPRPEPLTLVRRTLDGLLGHQVPEDWPDERWALLGTGRVPPGGGERRALGPDAARIPLLR
jgi:hypothetical protein